MSEKKTTYPMIYNTIMRNMKLLRKKGVLTARPGYKISGGKVIYKPAIVVTVAKKKEGLSARNKLPAEIGDTPLDVREATPMQLLRAKDPKSFHIIQALGPRELHEPESKWECDMKTGKLVAPASDTVEKITSPASGKKTKVSYSGPANASLNAINGKVDITAYASPDDGYTVLSSFLKGTTGKLTIGMYDFTSGDLLKDVVSTISRKKPDFTMVLDHPILNATANQTDEVTKKDIDAAVKKSLGKDDDIRWALDNMSPEVVGWIYPHAYHIKVVVRDSSSFWLSSGNFNVSNQPNMAAKDPKRGSFKTSDRDWHVIINHKGLAQLYEKYLQNDFTVAGPFQASPNMVAAKQKQLATARKQRQELNKSMSKLKKLQPDIAFTNPPAGSKSLGKQRTFTNAPVSIQPVLTPDPGKDPRMYITQILNLIQSAEKTIYIQMQYITPPPKTNDFQKLIDAVGNAFARGLDVRIIVSQFQKDISTEVLAKLKLDQVLRKQNRVHNKGIIIDSKKVLVSSQNWSSEGVMINRDAGVIIENADIASFFQEIFLDDWVNRAK
jgi:sugar-specific transcriptional regulator TrmB